MSHRLFVAWWPKWDMLTVGFLAVVIIAGTFLAGGVAAQPPCKSVSGQTWPGPPLPQWGVEPTHLHLSSGRHRPLTMMPKSLKYKTQI
jgi:hypothetical protein